MIGAPVHLRSRPLILAALVALALVHAVATPLPAFAHARLEATDPAGGATLDRAPRRVRLRFNEDIEPDFARVEVSDRTGERVDAGVPTVAGEIVTVPLRPSLTPGRYTVAFRVVSADGHPVEADFHFTVRNGAPVEPSPSLSAEPATEPEQPATDPAAEAAAPPGAPAEGEPSPSAASAVATGATGGTSRGVPTALLVVALLAGAVGGGTYLVVRRRTGAP